MLLEQFEIVVERSIGIVGGKPRAHLLIRQPLQLSSFASHPFALRHSLFSVQLPTLLPHNG
jgi:hypothetical protein